MSRLAVTGPGVAADPPWQAPPPPWQAPPPPWHALPLEERARLVESGRIDLADWRRQATAWAQTADSRYRACVELRPPHGGDASIRVGVKDTVDVAGFATRLGLPRYRHYPTQVSPLLDAPGWVARSADDLAFLWRRHRLGQPPGADQREPAGRFRVGVVQEALEDSLEPPVRGALNEVCDALAGNGHHLVPVRLGALWRQRGLTYELCTKAAWDRFRPGRGGIDDTLGESVRAALEVGAAVDGARHERLLTELYACRQAVSGRFQAQGVDLWLLPVGPLLPRDLRTTAPPASTIPQPGAPDYWKRVSYAAIASLAGLPAITFPVAHSRSHQAPVVAQAIGPVRSDGRLIQFARTVGSAQRRVR
jgi:Asp-tRNA(Asn)/Glu-tRNA(Gln) amidotransferase A subunit family amidase